MLVCKDDPIYLHVIYTLYSLIHGINHKGNTFPSGFESPNAANADVTDKNT